MAGGWLVDSCLLASATCTRWCFTLSISLLTYADISISIHNSAVAPDLSMHGNGGEGGERQDSMV